MAVLLLPFMRHSFIDIDGVILHADEVRAYFMLRCSFPLDGHIYQLISFYYAAFKRILKLNFLPSVHFQKKLLKLEILVLQYT
jgi:hypothetical protein